MGKELAAIRTDNNFDSWVFEVRHISDRAYDAFKVAKHAA